MRIDILTLFPQMFNGAFDTSIIKRSRSKDLLEIHTHDLRNWGEGERKNVDDHPYGGGPGMLLRVDIIGQALHDIKALGGTQKTKTILMDATGKRFTQGKARQLAELNRLILIAGHYEGFDHRVHEHLVDEVISIGDFVLTGGEIPAMAVTDAVIRLIPGVLGKKESLAEESFNQPGYIEYPQYTRPVKYKNWKVPDVLLSGNHEKIKKWREKTSDIG